MYKSSQSRQYSYEYTVQGRLEMVKRVGGGRKTRGLQARDRFGGVKPSLVRLVRRRSGLLRNTDQQVQTRRKRRLGTIW